MNVLRRAQGRTVRENAERHVHILAFADDRIEQRAAGFAAGVVSVGLAENKNVFFASLDGELFAPDAREGFERGPCLSPALRTVTIGRVLECIGDFQVDGAAQAPPPQKPLACTGIPVYSSSIVQGISPPGRRIYTGIGPQAGIAALEYSRSTRIYAHIRN